MSLKDLLSEIALREVITDSGIVLLLILTVIQIAPIKVNPWGWIAKKVGQAVNGELITKVDKLEIEMQKITAEAQENTIINCRIRVLRFGDEILHGVEHSRNHFEQILRDIDQYEKYCHEHPAFENGVTDATIARIKDVYRHLLETNGFLK